MKTKTAEMNLNRSKYSEMMKCDVNAKTEINNNKTKRTQLYHFSSSSAVFMNGLCWPLLSRIEKVLFLFIIHSISL